MTKKVLHMTYTLDTGGAEQVIANYVKFHSKERYTPIVCSLRGGGFIAEKIKQSGIKVYLYNKKMGFDFRTILFIRKILKKEDIKIIHAHNPNPNFYAVIAKSLTSTRTIVRTEHNTFRKGRVMPGYPLLNSILGLFNRKIIGVSDAVVLSHIKKDPLNQKKYSTVYNGIEDSLPFSFSKPSLDRLKNEIKIPENSDVVGIIANIHKQKAINYFLIAAKLILKEHSDTHFLIIGDGNEKENMEKLAKDLKIHDRVIFTGHRDDATKIMHIMNLFVLSSLWEGFPITILEAMRAGIPCVVTNVGGNREAVLNGKTGYIVPTRNPTLLAEKILLLLKNPSKAKMMGANGRLRFIEKFTAINMVNKTEQIYDRILSSY